MGTLKTHFLSKRSEAEGRAEHSEFTSGTILSEIVIFRAQKGKYVTFGLWRGTILSGIVIFRAQKGICVTLHFMGFGFISQKILQIVMDNH